VARRVAVIGAGIIGCCTAWYLRERGFEVDVFERRDGVALETSWGNAGVIAPGYVTPWAAPGMPRKVLSYLFAAEAPVIFRPVASPALARWILRWLRECELGRYRVNKSRMQRLAFHSRDALHALRARLGIDDGRRQGYLQLLRSERDLAMTGPARALLEENGVPHRLLDADAVRALEPALAPGVPLAGALWLPEDESASCPDFAQGLAGAACAACWRGRPGTCRDVKAPITARRRAPQVAHCAPTTPWSSPVRSIRCRCWPPTASVCRSGRSRATRRRCRWPRATPARGTR
jgi:D-amino-acid dehydrogenase